MPVTVLLVDSMENRTPHLSHCPVHPGTWHLQDLPQALPTWPARSTMGSGRTEAGAKVSQSLCLQAVGR